MRTLVARISLLALLASCLVVASPLPARAALPPSEWVIGPQAKVAFITFEGKTSGANLDALTEMLDRKRANVTFFPSGSWVAHHEDRARGLRRAGHFIGNRGWGKERFTALSSEQIAASIRRAESALAKVGARSAPFLRPPKGARNQRVLRVAGNLGYRSVRWTYRPGGGVAQDVKRKVMRRLQPGMIVSLDVWRSSHRKAAEMLIEGLRRKGYSLRTVDKLANVHAVRWDVTLRAGSGGSEVAYLEKRLRWLRYPAGSIDGSFDYPTLQAVYAFEKANRLARDGVVTPAQMTDIARSNRARAPKPRAGDPRNYIDVDIGRQVLYEVRDRKVTHILPISSGNEEYYYVDGDRRKAHTPRGNFKIERKIAGERRSDLGVLYWPNYFVGGYAIHGSNSVPTYPASHGCVRIPRYVERKFFNRTPIGLAVFVHD